MGYRKYASDYRLDKQLTGSGKVRTTAVYKGAWFNYCESPEAIRRLAITVICCAVAVVALLLPMLFCNTLISYTIYALLPMAFVLFPAYQLILVGARLFRFKAPLTHEQKDQTEIGLRRGCLWLLILQSIHFAGCAVYCFTPGVQEGEWPIIICVAVSMAVAIFMMTLRNKAKTVEVQQ